MGWIINTPQSWQGKMTWREEWGMKRRWKEFGEVRDCIKWSRRFCFWRLLKTEVQIALWRQTSSMYILYYPYLNSILRKNHHHPIIFLQLTLSLHYPLVSPPSGFAEAPTPETHTGFNTPVSPQSSALFVRCVDAFIGLKWLLCSLPAVYSQAVIPLLHTVCGLVMQFV